MSTLSSFEKALRRWRFWPHPPMSTFDQHAPRPLLFVVASDERRPIDPPIRITIVTPSYNQRKYLEATVNSVLGQNYPALCYHVQDAASQDGTMELLTQYGSRLGWRSEPDTGQGNAINTGFRIATIDCDVMAYLNSDDTLLPGTLSYVAGVFRDRPDIDIVYGHSAPRCQSSSVHRVCSAGDNVLAPPRMGQDWTDRRKLSICAGLGFHAAGAASGVHHGSASKISRMLPDSRRAKNICNDACWIGRDAVASSPAPRSSPEPGRNLSRGCAVSRAAACVPRAISVERLEILPLMRILAYPEVQEHSELGGSAQQARWSSVRLHVFDCEASLSMRTGIQA